MEEMPRSRSLRSLEADPVRRLSKKMRLREGEEAIERVLREVYRRKLIGTKELARATRLPIPVVAAIRRELEKEGVLARRGGAVLTELGENYVEEHMGASRLKIAELVRTGDRLLLSGDFTEQLKKLKKHFLQRPEPIPQLDQAYATPDTALKRALYMLAEGDLEGREVVFMGDDDMTSIAVGLLKVARGITVVDIDERLLRVIEEVSKQEDLGVQCFHHDLRSPLPKKIRNRCDTAFTDPPYTVPGVSLFLSRCIQALKIKKTGSVYLAFADKRPMEMLAVHEAILNMGLFVRELIPGFNVYEGAEIFANTTSLMKLSLTEATRPLVVGGFEGKLYTGEVHPTIRVYRCKCGEKIEVGVNKEFETIKELKSKGCPKCGQNEAFKLYRRIRGPSEYSRALKRKVEK